MSNQNRIEFLVKEIKHHRDLYYNEQAEISDAEFDIMEKELRNLDPANKLLKEIGASPKRSKIKNPTFLGSLDKVSMEKFPEWLSKHDDILISEKLDGMSVWIEFDKGSILKAGTRGDGQIGEDITDKVKTFVPEIKSSKHVILRGEAILKGDELYGYKNRRNAVAGILNRDDNKNVDKLSVKFYTVIDGKQTVECDFLFIESLGLPVAEWKHIGDKTKLQKQLDHLLDNKDQDYDIDGYVVQSGDEKIAYKHDSEAVETEVENIEWNVTRTGRIQPVLNVKPIYITGIEVRNATAFNAKFIRDNRLGKGSKVSIVRANEVIPYIEKVLSESPDYKLPKICPSCGVELGRNGVDLVCLNTSCYEQNILKIMHFMLNLDVEGMSDTTLRKISVNTIYDLYDPEIINVKRIAAVGGLGTTSATRIIDEINKTLLTTPVKLLAAFGISNFSEKMAQKLLQNFKFDQIFDLTYANLIDIEGIGPNKAQDFLNEIVPWKKTYEFLKSKGLKFIEQKTTDTLKGKSFCITGTLSKPRKEFETMIVNSGGRLGSVSKKLDYLVTGSSATQHKVEKAKQLAIPIIDESKLISLLK